MTRDRILDTSWELFRTRGFDGTTVTEIEARAGLAAGSGGFYRHFASKEQVLRAVVDREVERADGERELPTEVLTADARIALTLDFQRRLSNLRRLQPLMVVLAREQHHLGDAKDRLRQLLLEKNLSLRAEVLRGWMDQGAIPRRDPQSLATIITASLYTDSDLGDRVVNGISEIWSGIVRYRAGRAYLSDVERVAERNAVSPVAVLEVQDFRGSKGKELVFTAYAHQGGEVMGVELGRDIADGSATNYSNSPVYEEVEGIAPDGSYALVERDLQSSAIPGPLDIWRLRLDGSSEFERLTFFNRYRGGYYASNPAVSPDGRTIAFQLSIDGPVEGAGQGILLFDVEAFEDASES